MNYAIIAAGEGSRLRREGFEFPKPMVRLKGEMLVERLIRIFKANKAESITVIINEQSGELRSMLEKMAEKDGMLNIIVKTTPSSAHSFYTILESMGKDAKDLCLTTVDTVFNESIFSSYIKTFEQEKDMDALMGTTAWVDDEKPLWIDEDENGRIRRFSSEQVSDKVVISGGIYCFRNRALAVVDKAKRENVSRMRNVQQMLVENGCKVAGFDFGKIIDIDHVEDIRKAELFLENGNCKILCVERERRFSPQCEDIDKALFDSIYNGLRKEGFATERINEQELKENDFKGVDFVISMARSLNAVELLDKKEKEGLKIFNSISSCRNCYRERMNNMLHDAGVDVPDFKVVDTDCDNPKCMDFADISSFWVKRADFQTEGRNDVVYCQTAQDGISVLHSMKERGIKRALLSEHIDGNLIKFYKVAESGFLYWYLPKRDKFGMAINEKIRVEKIDEEGLKEITDKIGRCMGFDFFGGDIMVDASGKMKVIDVNDFPSYCACRDQAVEAIVKRMKMEKEKLGFKENKPKMEDTLKSADTEECIDIWFYRPLGFRCALLARKLKITPNMITVFSIFVGVAAGLFFYPSDLKWNIVGMVLLVLANLMDSTDGQLARLTNNHTRLGRILDGLAGDLWFICIYIVCVLRLLNEGFSNWIWLLASLAGLSHIFHAAMADYYRNIHLFIIKGRKGSEQDNSKAMTQLLHQTRFSEKPFEKICLWFYRNYTRQQEMLTPKMQILLERLRTRFNDEIPEDLRHDLRMANKSNMPLTNILQFNTRVIVLFICLFVGQVWWYFVFDVVIMNAILLVLIIREENFAKRFIKRTDE